MARAAARQAGPTSDIAAPANHTPKASPAKVIIGCKIHIAYLELELCAPLKTTEQTMQGPRDIIVHFRTGQKHTIRGLAYPAGTPPEGFADRPTVVGGYALTRDIPGAFWDAWKEQNLRNPLVINDMVVAYPDVESIKSLGRETAEVKSGLEPIQRKKIDGHDVITDKRVTKPTIGSITPLESGKDPSQPGSNAE